LVSALECYFTDANIGLSLCSEISKSMKFTEITIHLGKFRVGIAGAGGLGSNCAIALARSGVGTLVIADFDVVEPANLNRQYYFSDQVGMAKTDALKENICRIDSSVIVTTHKVRLDTENIPLIFAECDIIVEAFDQASEKEMLIETVQEKMPLIPLIVGSGMAGWGKTDLLKCKKADDFLYVCGDESSEVSDELPCIAPRVGIVSNMQANLVLEILLGKEKKSS
jgi:sulfur carrier protein ThiS adenylyltransferase